MNRLTPWLIGGALLSSLFIAWQVGFIINTTSSLPRGLWYVIDHASPHPGDVVVFCPPNRTAFQRARERGYIGGGRCPGNYEMMLKPVVAVAGDRVVVKPAAVAVNGRLIIDSGSQDYDTAGRPLFPLRGTVIIPPHHLWLMSTWSSRSYDSRYFGPVDAHHIIGRAVPILTEAVAH